jgi:hypothetical protein
MKKLRFALLLLAELWAPLSQAHAVQVVLGANKDNSMYGEAPNNSNGLGDHFVAGKIGGATGLRRGLIAFDLAGLPSEIRIDRVALELVFQGTTNQESDPRVVSLHRLLANWGEGTSDAGPGGTTGSGNGAPATINDATWRYRFFDTQTWASHDPAVAGSGGGDFVSQASATATVGIDPGPVVSWETLRGPAPTGLVADVEQWLTDPSSNFGWLLKMVDESPLRTARRFYSKDEVNAALHPRLVIDYSIVPEPAVSAILTTGILGLWIVIRAPRRR